MKKNKQLVPKRRFKEFESDGEWEQHKLKDVVRFTKGRGYAKRDLTESGTPIILYGRLYTNFETVINEVNTFAKAKDNSVYSTGTEVIVPSSGETAEDIARAAAVRKEGVILGGDLNIMHLVESKDPVFLALSISNGNRKKELIKRAQGSSVVHLYNTDLEEAEVFFPKIEEQQKISSFFKHIDNLINLQKNKIEKSKKLKDSYLSVMFPKEGEKYPKKRFQGFSEPWDKTNLERVARVKTGYPFNSGDFDEEGEYLVITNGNIQDTLSIVDSASGNRITPNDNTVIDEYLLNPKDILVTMDGTVGRTAKVIETNQILAQRVGRLIANINPEFLYQSLQTGDFFEKMSLISHGGTIKHISLSEIESYELMVPSNSEQIKIANFFENIDNQITLEEQKLNKLEQLKQAYLNELFV